MKPTQPDKKRKEKCCCDYRRNGMCGYQGKHNICDHIVTKKTQSNTKTQKESWQEEFDDKWVDEHAEIVKADPKQLKSWIHDLLSSHTEQVEQDGFKRGFKDCENAIKEGKHNHCCFKKILASHTEQVRKEERERYEKYVEVVDALASGAAFDTKTGLIWQHILDIAKALSSTEQGEGK